MRTYGEKRWKKSHPWTTNPRIPSRERSHIPPGEKENHRLKGCRLVGGYVSSLEGKLKVFVAHQSWLPMASQHGALQALWSASIHGDVALTGNTTGRLWFMWIQLIQCCSDLSNNWWPFESLEFLRIIMILLLFFVCVKILDLLTTYSPKWWWKWWFPMGRIRKKSSPEKLKSKKFVDGKKDNLSSKSWFL